MTVYEVAFPVGTAELGTDVLLITKVLGEVADGEVEVIPGARPLRE